MNWQKVVLLAFGLSIMFVYAPLITLIAGAILLAIYNGQEIKNAAGKSLSFIQVLALGFIIALTAQAVLTIIFGASFDTLVQAGGLLIALKNPDAIKVGVIKEVFALIIVFCMAYLVVTAPTPQRWLFKWAIVLSVIALMFQCWNNRFPLSDDSKDRYTDRLSLLREEVIANMGSRLDHWNSLLNHSTVLNEHTANMPTAYYATPDAYLYEKDGDGVKRGEKVKVGSRWFHLVDDEVITDVATGITYEPVAAYNDETKRGYLRVDRLSKNKPVIKTAVASVSPPKSVSPPPLRIEIEITPPKEESKPLINKEEIILADNSNLITVTTNEWVTTGIATNLGDRVELGRFPVSDDVKRLQARIAGGFPAIDLKPKRSSDGRWCAVLRRSDDNEEKNCHQIELRLKQGPPLMVTACKL